MIQISASMVKELREKTGAGMMDCKKALNETQGNMEEAIDWLRTKGLAAAAKKAGRIAAEGLVGVCVEGMRGAVVEVNAETDFIAKNEAFQTLVSAVSKNALSASDLDALSRSAYAGEASTIGEELTRLIAVIGENMSLRRFETLSVDQGVVASYVHSQIAPNLGRIGVLLALESSADQEKLHELAKKICMHIAASNPQALTREAVDPDLIERERAIFSEQAKESGKPEEFIEKMVEGRIQKYYKEIVLLEQPFVMDGKTPVKTILDEASKDLGAPISIKGYVRYGLGDGIEKKQNDFAAEVQAQVAGN
jgi:elongation factor Ts